MPLSLGIELLIHIPDLDSINRRCRDRADQSCNGTGTEMGYVSLVEASLALRIAEFEEPVFCGVVRGELGGGDDHCAGCGRDHAAVETGDTFFDVDGSAGVGD